MELSVEVGAAVVVVVWCGGWLAVLSLSLTLWGGKARPKLLLALRGNGGGLRLCFMGFPGVVKSGRARSLGRCDWGIKS